jgi:uncharacterized protein YggE
MKTFLFLLLILPVSVFAEGGLPNQPYIYVEGNAEIQKAADIVRLHFELVARASDQAKANEEVQAKAINVFGLLKDHKIADNDVIAETIQSDPEFEQEQNYQNRGKLIGYVVRRPFDVNVRDVTVFPKLVNKLIAVGGTEFRGIEPGLASEQEMEARLWEKALSNAREQAEKTLKPMDMKIQSVFAVSPVAFLDVQRRFFASGEKVIVTGSNVPTAEEVGPARYQLAPVTLSQTIHVIYLISPAK